jgi:hypothetical protein
MERIARLSDRHFQPSLQRALQLSRKFMQFAAINDVQNPVPAGRPRQPD